MYCKLQSSIALLAMKTCFSSKHLFPTDVAKGEFENTCSVKPRKQNLSFIISRSNFFVADRFQNWHEEERARECSSKGKIDRKREEYTFDQVD